MKKRLLRGKWLPVALFGLLLALSAAAPSLRKTPKHGKRRKWKAARNPTSACIS